MEKDQVILIVLLIIPNFGVEGYEIFNPRLDEKSVSR